MIGKRILIGAACLMAMQGAMAQVDGVTGASVQTARILPAAKVKRHCCNTPAEQLKVSLQKLLNKGIMVGHQDRSWCMVLPGNGMKERAMCFLLQVIIPQ